MSAKPTQTGKKKPRAVAVAAQPVSNVSSGSAPLLADLHGMILATRQSVARAIDSGLVTLWVRAMCMLIHWSARRIRVPSRNWSNSQAWRAKRII